MRNRFAGAALFIRYFLKWGVSLLNGLVSKIGLVLNFIYGSNPQKVVAIFHLLYEETTHVTSIL
jgi:hypothetical protein